MENLILFLYSWGRYILMPVVTLLPWPIARYVNSTLHDGCNDINSKFPILREACIEEGIRNAEVIDTVTLTLFIIALCVSFILGLINYLKKAR